MSNWTCERAKVVGVEPVSFRSQEGKEINGTQMTLEEELVTGNGQLSKQTFQITGYGQTSGSMRNINVGDVVKIGGPLKYKWSQSQDGRNFCNSRQQVSLVEVVTATVQQQVGQVQPQQVVVNQNHAATQPQGYAPTMPQGNEPPPPTDMDQIPF